MPHVPRFPPIARDWEPGKPPLEPPLPRFMWNPSWLSEKQREPILAEAGKWATARAEAMVPQKAGPEAVRRAALSMWGGLQRRYGIVEPAPTPRRVRRAEAPTEVRRQRRPRAVVPTVAELVLAPQQRRKLSSDIKEYVKGGLGTARGPVLPSTMDVQEWASEQFETAISEEEAASLVTQVAQASRAISL